jgi:A/G-specific adenine glycosylase
MPPRCGAVPTVTTSGSESRRAAGSDTAPIRRRSELSALGQAIATWGSAAGGSSRRSHLPWRATRDPWAVLVSEVMTQQTQVARVVPVYERFLAAFPTPAACAAAPLDAVLRSWRGLGYNRRARSLHLAAQRVVSDHSGRVPDDVASLEALPGVGSYTARAVLAFAFQRDVGVVDTNAARVLARAAAGRSLRRAEAQQVVDAMVPPGRAWQFGQALLDLGATVCTPAPACTTCPVRRRCRWSAKRCVEPDPAHGSSGVSRRQARFRGSDREGRGRLVDALRDGSLAEEEVAAVAGWTGEPTRAVRVVADLVAEGLVVRDARGGLRLPG